MPCSLVLRLPRRSRLFGQGDYGLAAPLVEQDEQLLDDFVVDSEYFAEQALVQFLAYPVSPIFRWPATACAPSSLQRFAPRQRTGIRQLRGAHRRCVRDSGYGDATASVLVEVALLAGLPARGLAVHHSESAPLWEGNRFQTEASAEVPAPTGRQSCRWRCITRYMVCPASGCAGRRDWRGSHPAVPADANNRIAVNGTYRAGSCRGCIRRLWGLLGHGNPYAVVVFQGLDHFDGCHVSTSQQFAGISAQLHGCGLLPHRLGVTSAAASRRQFYYASVGLVRAMARCHHIFPNRGFDLCRLDSHHTATVIRRTL